MRSLLLFVLICLGNPVMAGQSRSEPQFLSVQAIFHEKLPGRAGTATLGMASWAVDRSAEHDPVRVSVSFRTEAPDVALRIQAAPANASPTALIGVSFSGESTAFQPWEVAKLGLVFKRAEPVHGERLYGKTSKVGDGQFRIATSPEPLLHLQNVEAVGLATWIDLPIILESGRAVLIAFELLDPARTALLAILTWIEA